MLNCFASEEELVQTALQSPGFIDEFYAPNLARWEAREVEGLFGIPDFMIAYGRVSSEGCKEIKAIAFEMKIKNWRRALTQAYRYSAFAHYSYVIMDEAFCRPAIQNIDMFQKSNIGLLSIDINSQLRWYHRPRYQDPYSFHLYKNFYDSLYLNLFKTAIQQ